MPHSYHKRAFSGMAYNYLGKLVSAVLSFFTFTYIVKAVSVEEYGFYSSIINIIFFITLILDFGIPEIVLRYFPEYMEKKDPYIMKEILSRCLKLIFRGSAILVIAALILLFSFHNNAAVNSFLRFTPFLVILGSLKVLSLVFSNILNAFLYQGYRNMFEVLTALLKLILTSISINMGLGVCGIVISCGIADFFLIVSSFLRLYKPLYGQARANSPAQKVSLQRFEKFGRNEYFYKLFWFFTDNRIDIYIVTFFLGITSAGCFAFAINTTNMLMEWTPGTIFRNVISPLFVRQYAKNKGLEELQYLFQLYNKFLLFLTFPIYLFIGILSKEIITYVFDQKYLTAIRPFQLFLFFTFFINFIIPIRSILSVLERPDISNLSNVFAVLKFIFILFFINYYNINAVAIAYGITLFAIIAFNLSMMRTFFTPRYPREAILKIAVNGLVIGVALSLVKSHITNTSGLITMGLMGFMAYAGLSYYNKPFSDYDRELLNSGLKMRLWKF